MFSLWCGCEWYNASGDQRARRGLYQAVLAWWSPLGLMSSYLGCIGRMFFPSE
ncbi:hypothetical protein BO71DRAFT_178791 [Aspergillus ellipticus CBS 707.79]|uniref:Uncharacterized protein n=1 Tax=Aspergillus ellipticus CBS 707.79 TaxID=1448320 RepID=A0A319DQL3_9EURO|nr:hypothetical protein BO71DRAFT_178791 [Aspergillus ellipticus CBS 707.79]